MTTEREPLLKPVAVEELRPTMKQALILAKSKDADYLPGWCGPTSD